ncbi:MAG TPA: acetamidase/formamidase family protein, partial [Phycisphaeraceae bacterium]
MTQQRSSPPSVEHDAAAGAAPHAFLSPRFYYTFGPHAPALIVPSGTTLDIACPDSDNAWADGSTLTLHQRQEAAGSELFQGNPLAGPIAVEGVQAGETLAVTIERIILGHQPGQTLLAPGHGAVPSDLLRSSDPTDAPMPKHLHRWVIAPRSQSATLVNPLGGEPLIVPLRPFVGAIGVCPPWGQAISSLHCGPFGGNLDLPLLAPGVTIDLPVYHAGALLMMGDIHAAQGHGELVGGGIETAGRIVCTVRRVADGRRFDFIRLRHERFVGAVAVEGDLRRAVQCATAHLLDWLSAAGRVHRWDLY